MTIDRDDMKKTVRKYQKWVRKTWNEGRLGKAGQDFVFLYAAWGSAFANLPGEEWLEALKDGRTDEVPAPRQESWSTTKALARQVRKESNGYALMPWLMLPVGHWERWDKLQSVHMVGPSTASWILRDVSLWMDRRPVLTRREIHLGRQRKGQWFRKLPIWAQAKYLPMTRWVHEACLEHGVYDETLVDTNDRKQHEARATRLAEWCAERDLDARHVNIYWYAQGSHNV